MGEQIVGHILGTLGPTLAAVTLLFAPTLVWFLISRGRAPGPERVAVGVVDVSAMWLCEGCRSVNAARSTRCYHCRAGRPADAPAAAQALADPATAPATPDRPRRVSGLSPATAAGSLAVNGARLANSSQAGVALTASAPPVAALPVAAAAMPVAAARPAIAGVTVARGGPPADVIDTAPDVKRREALPITRGVPVMAPPLDRVAVTVEAPPPVAVTVQAPPPVAITAAPTTARPPGDTDVEIATGPSAEAAPAGGLAPSEVRTTCPLLTVRGRPGVVFSFANADHQCQASARASRIDPAHQLRFCLSGGYPECQRYVALAERVSRAR